MRVALAAKPGVCTTNCISDSVSETLYGMLYLEVVEEIVPAKSVPIPTATDVIRRTVAI